MLLVFVGITAVFKLSVEVVTNNKARTGALALAQERMEYIRSLSYSDVGTLGGVPAGNITQTESVSLNGVSYIRRTVILYVDDPKDGEGVNDENGIITDYKQVKVTLSWSTQSGARSTNLISRVSPPGIEQEVPGGVLRVTVLDASVSPVASADVRIINDSTDPVIDTTVLTNTQGVAMLVGAPEATDYEIVVSKTGYSTSQTHDTSVGNPNPSPGHLTVVEDSTTASTFSIDVVSEKIVQTFRRIEEAVWDDSFNDSSKIASTASTTISSGSLSLESSATVGTAQSISVAPSYLYSWNTLYWESVEPVGSSATFRLYYIGGSGPEIIPEENLPGNAAGFTASPVDISNLSTTIYPVLIIHTTLIGEGGVTDPEVEEYHVSYDSGPIPLPNIAFSMRGSKTIGTDGTGVAIYKYDENLSSGASASYSSQTIEWDTYIVEVDGSAIGYDIAESCDPQPKSINPNTSVTTKLYLADHTTNSLRVNVVNDSGALLEDAQVRLYRGAYDETTTTSNCGGTFFNALSAGTGAGGDVYSLDVILAGYDSITAQSTDVSGASVISVVLTEI